MTRQEIINQAKRIIIEKSKPYRIWLYGSQTELLATETSDIDLAYWRDKDKKTTKVLSEIKEQVEQLNTLVKIDVIDLSLCEERFINRVKSTGKIIFSATKELRAEDALYNFARAKQRLEESIILSYSVKDKYIELEDIFIDVLVKRFEFTFEMCWKTIKRVLAYKGITVNSPRECFKAAFEQKWISNEAMVLEMIEMRNTMSHTYDLSAANEIKYQIKGYYQTFHDIYLSLENAID